MAGSHLVNRDQRLGALLYRKHHLPGRTLQSCVDNSGRGPFLEPLKPPLPYYVRGAKCILLLEMTRHRRNPVFRVLRFKPPNHRRRSQDRLDTARTPLRLRAPVP
jgi:hypothetical protein